MRPTDKATVDSRSVQSYAIVKLKHVKAGLRLICIKFNNDHNFVKIYQNLPKFGNLGKIGNLNFSVT